MNKTKFFSMRLPPDVYEAVHNLAAKENRTVAGQILHILLLHLELRK